MSGFFISNILNLIYKRKKFNYMVYSNNFGQTRLGIRFVSQVVNAVDADATAFIAAAGITNLTQASAITTLVNDLKTYGIWSKMKAIYPMVGGTAAQHRFNLKDPRTVNAAFYLDFMGGGTHSANGYQPNGTTAYADTKLTPYTNLLTNSHISIYLNTVSSNDPVPYVMGSYNGETQALAIRTFGNSDNTSRMYNYDRVSSVNNISTSNGFWMSNIISGQSRALRNNLLLSSLPKSGTSPTANMFIGALNVNNVAGAYAAQSTCLVSMGDALTLPEETNLYTAVQKYQTTLGRQIGTPIVSDTDAQAFLNAAVITDVTQANAVNTLVVDLKAANIWTKMKALYPMVGGSATSHKFNLKDPRDLDAAYRLVFNGGWVHTTTGALPNGTTGYADTKLIPSSALTAFNLHISYYSRTDSSNSSMIGLQDDSVSNGSQLYLAGDKTTDYYSATNTDANRILVSSTNTIGYYIASRLTSQNLKAYKNGSQVGSNIQNSLGYKANISMYIGGFNYKNMYNVVSIDYGNKEAAFASIGDGLSDTEAANFYTAVQKYQSTLGRQIGAPIVSDTDAQAFLNAAVITDVTQANAVNTLVTDLKAAGVWTKMKALYPMVGGTAAQHRFNLKDPRTVNAAFYLEFFGGGIHSATGYQPNGTTSYADTKLIPNNILQLNSSHFSYYSRTNVLEASVEMMAYTSGQSMIDLYVRFTNGNMLSRIYNTTTSTTSVPSSLGLFLMNRPDANTIKQHRNSDIISSSSSTTAGTKPNINLYIGTGNNNGSTFGFSSKEAAFASIGDGLTDGEAAAFYTAVQKYQTTLGRAV